MEKETVDSNLLNSAQQADFESYLPCMERLSKFITSHLMLNNRFISIIRDTRVKILNETAYVSHRVNISGNPMDQSTHIQLFVNRRADCVLSFWFGNRSGRRKTLHSNRVYTWRGMGSFRLYLPLPCRLRQQNTPTVSQQTGKTPPKSVPHKTLNNLNYARALGK